MKYLIFICMFLVAGVLQAQNIEELKKDLEAAPDRKTKSLLNLQIADAYFTKGGKLEEAENYAKKAHDIADRDGLTSIAGQAAYLLGEIDYKDRNYRGAEVWFKSSLRFAKQANDPDLIIKSVNKRGRIAKRDNNYRRAYDIYEEAFSFFSDRGKSVSELEKQYEIQKAQLQRERNALQREKDLLKEEIGALNDEKTQLTERQKRLIKEKSKVEQEISQKEVLLDSISFEKQEVEELAKTKTAEIEKLSEVALKREFALSKAETELSKAELQRKKAELEATKNRNLRNLLILVSGFIVLLAFLFYLRYRSKKKASDVLADKNKIIEKERERSDELLRNILPAEIAEELKEKGKATARKYNNVTVMFTDFKDFTKISEKLTPEQLVQELDHCFKAFDYIIEAYDIEKIKTIGDAYMCASGLTSRTTFPNDIIKAALEMQEFMEDYKRERLRLGLPYFEARIGLHTGPVVAGVVGVNKFAYDIWGDTVNTASRLESKCEVGQVNISEITFRQVKYNFECIHRGKIEAKNIGMIDMYYVKKELSEVTV